MLTCEPAPRREAGRSRWQRDGWLVAQIVRLLTRPTSGLRSLRRERNERIGACLLRFEQGYEDECR